MEKPPGKAKGRSPLKFLQKAASFSIPNTAYSPARDRANLHRPSSVPAVPMIPVEVRGRALEPTSPRVTCVGRVHCRKQDSGGTGCRKEKESMAWLAALRWLFRARARLREGHAGAEDGGVVPQPTVSDSTAPPPLGQLRRFASGRERFRASVCVAPGAVADETGEERAGGGTMKKNKEEEKEGEEPVVPVAGSSAVGLVVAAGGVGPESRKEMNLWERRAVARLRSLEV